MGQSLFCGLRWVLIRNKTQPESNLEQLRFLLKHRLIVACLEDQTNTYYESIVEHLSNQWSRLLSWIIIPLDNRPAITKVFGALFVPIIACLAVWALSTIPIALAIKLCFTVRTGCLIHISPSQESRTLLCRFRDSRFAG